MDSYGWFTQWKWWFSIVFCMFTRGYPLAITGGCCWYLSMAGSCYTRTSPVVWLRQCHKPAILEWFIQPIYCDDWGMVSNCFNHIDPGGVTMAMSFCWRENCNSMLANLGPTSSQWVLLLPGLKPPRKRVLPSQIGRRSFDADFFLPTKRHIFWDITPTFCRTSWGKYGGSPIMGGPKPCFFLF